MKAILNKMFRGVETEVVFHPTRKWRVDYLWRKEMIALEVEGGIWIKGGGAHSRPMNIQRDVDKYNELALMGYLLIRATPQMMKDGRGVVLLERAFKQRKNFSPHRHYVYDQITNPTDTGENK